MDANKTPALTGRDIERFWGRVDTTRGPSSCWPRGTATIGYSEFVVRRDGVKIRLKSHRVAYELCRGAIPRGKVVDHLCHNTICVNPSHLRITTSRENTIRGRGPTAIRAQADHCPNGHEYTISNTGVKRYRGRGPSRLCLECYRARQNSENAARRAARAAARLKEANREG